MSNSYDDIQTRDRTDTATAAENLLKERVEQRLYQENLEIEAEVRSLISDAEAALVGQSDDDPEELLSRAHWMLWLDPDRREVLRGDVLGVATIDLAPDIFRHRGLGHRSPPSAR